MSFTTFVPRTNTEKRLSSSQHKESTDNRAVNPYWPKALITPFMMNRNIVTSVKKTKKGLHSKIVNKQELMIMKDK